MSLSNLKLVTFDVTNTLLKFRLPPWEHYAQIARPFGFVGVAEELKGSFLNSYKVMWKEYPNFGKDKIEWHEWWTKVVFLTFKGRLPTKANTKQIANILIDDFRTEKCWCCSEGCTDLVQLLRSENMTLGVISNFDPTLSDILQCVNLRDKFDFILTSYEIGFSKPNKIIFNKALEKCLTSVSPAQALHIGDDYEKDYKGAKSAGWHAVLITNHGAIDKPATSNHVFSSLEKLYEAIENDKLHL